MALPDEVLEYSAAREEAHKSREALHGAQNIYDLSKPKQAQARENAVRKLLESDLSVIDKVAIAAYMDDESASSEPLEGIATHRERVQARVQALHDGEPFFMVEKQARGYYFVQLAGELSVRQVVLDPAKPRYGLGLSLGNTDTATSSVRFNSFEPHRYLERRTPMVVDALAFSKAYLGHLSQEDKNWIANYGSWIYNQGATAVGWEAIKDYYELDRWLNNQTDEDYNHVLNDFYGHYIYPNMTTALNGY